MFPVRRGPVTLVDISGFPMEVVMIHVRQVLQNSQLGARVTCWIFTPAQAYSQFSQHTLHSLVPCKSLYI